MCSLIIRSTAILKGSNEETDFVVFICLNEEIEETAFKLLLSAEILQWIVMQTIS